MEISKESLIVDVGSEQIKFEPSTEPEPSRALEKILEKFIIFI